VPTLSLALVALALALAAAAPLDVRPAPHDGETRCGACHTTADWREVAFAHDRTGFPLAGRHATTPCGSCHQGGTFKGALPTLCVGCHRDVHLARMGSRCDRCHGVESWRVDPAGPEEHRRTDFPLTGRHAVIPCEECHGDRRDRTWSRPTTRCVTCHALDFGVRSAAAGVDHVAGGFPEDCRRCHGAWRFRPARFPAHDACFQVSRGPHSGIACRDCHDAGVPPMPPGGVLSCATDTADCLRCHTMPGIQARHAGVAGFQPYNRRCYECHRFAG
jgi:hypothetical protein